MAAERTNASLDGWFMVKRKSLKKSLVEFYCEANGGDEVTEETVPTMKLIDESHKTVTDTKQSATLGTTEVCRIMLPLQLFKIAGVARWIL